MKIQYTLLLFILVFLSSCKKDTSLDNLSNVILKREGLLRVECNDCEINYQVNSKAYNVDIDKGSNDIAFFYSGDFDLKTEVVSKANQKIRLLVMDSFGRVISNELNTWSAGEVRKQTFMINVK
jgi:competence protein ComGF